MYFIFCPPCTSCSFESKPTGWPLSLVCLHCTACRCAGGLAYPSLPLRLMAPCEYATQAHACIRKSISKIKEEVCGPPCITTTNLIGKQTIKKTTLLSKDIDCCTIDIVYDKIASWGNTDFLNVNLWAACNLSIRQKLYIMYMETCPLLNDWEY